MKEVLRFLTGPEEILAGYTTRHFPLFLKKTEDLLNPSNQTRLHQLLHRRLARGNGSLTRKKYVFLNQVHGNRVAIPEDEGRAGDTFFRLREADAAITQDPETILLVLTADCLPIFLSAGEWTGLVHAGWRGTQKNIAAKAFGLILEKSACRPEDVHIGFGPRIGRDHYEVGEEFTAYFGESRGSRSSVLERREGKIYFDLAAENRSQLLEAGASPANIEDPGVCTVCDAGNFYSHRLEKEAAGRTLSFITRENFNAEA